METKPAEEQFPHRADAGQRRPASDSARCRDAQAGAGGAAGTGVIHLPASVRVYLCTSPCDMRRSFDGLHALVTGAMKLDAFAGHLFCFCQPAEGPGEDSVLGSRRVRGVGQAAGRRHLRDAVRRRRRTPARDHGAGVGCAVKRHRSEPMPSAGSDISARARKPHKDWLRCILCLADKLFAL